MNAPIGPGVPGLNPVSENERIDALDVLRGFALLGILFVNIGFFAHPVSAPFYLAPDASALDVRVHELTALFAQGKFYPLFSLLFGAGFAMQLVRAQERRADLAPLYMRRLLVLLIIGVLHGVFIWAGDILTAYALLGFLLLLAVRARPVWLLAAALAAYALQFALIGGFTLALAGLHADPQATAALLQELTAGIAQADALRARAWEVYAAGSYLEVTQVRAQEFFLALQNMPFFGLQVFAMFLLGAWLVRHGVFAHPLLHGRLLKSLALAGAAVGLPLAWLFARMNADIDYLGKPVPAMGIALLLNLVAGLLLALAYMAAITLAMQTRAARWLRVLAPLGRMALSNYLLQSIAGTLIFYSYGLGLFGKPGAGALAAIALLIFVMQLALSHAWLQKFQHGPLEWLWRCVTYGYAQPLRRMDAISGPAKGGQTRR